MYQGVFTALITPFKNGKVDERAYQDLINWQIAEGIHGVVPCGTTGESPTLSHEEHKRLVELCVEAANGRVPVMAGTGSNNTVEAIDLTRHAQKAGANAALVVAPYYNKPTQEGLYQHYKALHDATDIPIFIYNIPGRSVIDVKDDTIARLAELPRIAGLKDATGDLARISSLRKRIGDRLCLLSGEDPTALAFNAQGGKGCISVTSNIAPKQCAAMHDAWFAGKPQEALRIHDSLIAVHEAMFCETNPSPVKYAASLKGKCTSEVRLPLVQPGEESKKRIKAALEKAGIL
ncbi:MAG: 4-hydroxy-tetrahydrodipicolinate synthase [Alphaproteobacteria bacterium]|nr:4-hydroxy-tetrahydrodipicolinate synthase [Alphaproteobacteria bacterium]